MGDDRHWLALMWIHPRTGIPRESIPAWVQAIRSRSKRVPFQPLSDDEVAALDEWMPDWATRRPLWRKL